MRPRRFARQGNHVLEIFAGLETKCPGNHKHDSCAPRIVNGRPHYPTKAEAAYPALLCQRIAALVRHRCSPNSLPPPIHGPASSELRCAMDKQSRKAAPLVEEYSSMDLWAIPMDDPACLQQLLRVYLKGSRVTQRHLVSSENIRAGLNPSLDSESLRNSLSSRWSWKTKRTGDAEMTSETTHHLVCGFAWSPNQKPTAEVIWIGIPRSVQSFLNDAIQKGHPKSLLTRVPDPALQKLVDNLLGSRLKEPGAGLDKLEEWKTRRTASQVDESKIRETMDPIVNRIMKGKETVLLEQLLNEYKFPDSHLVSDMRSGFALSGWVRNSKLFVPFLRPPRSTVAMQLALAPAKKALVERTLNVQLEGMWPRRRGPKHRPKLRKAGLRKTRMLAWKSTWWRLGLGSTKVPRSG